ncbi:MAG: exodeoxyribonuclease V subunit alpha [Rhodanobacteraceae bacterium]|nr:exodeoxyribonuclease V subunit alpha [Rhodanobacteraceae bacterium]
MRLKPQVAPPPSTPVALGRWARARTGSEALARALEAAAQAEFEGHACARLDPSSARLDELRAHPWVGDGSRMTPLVLSADGACYLWRNHVHEARVGSAILARAGHPAHTDAQDLADLDTLFAPMDPVRASGQREAVRRSLGRRFLVISGGPGTGKTTTVLRLLLLRLRQAARAGRACAIALAAPTGKAAQRLSQSLRSGLDQLRAQLAGQPGDWDAALAGVPDGARTLHRLLGADPRADRFRHDAENPLPHDLVVVDEASMVDLGLMRALLDALPPQATLVLVGDPDQLVSVSAGSVLADVVAAAAQGPLADCLAPLAHGWRSGGRLPEVNAAVRAGDRAGLERLIGDGVLERAAVTDAASLDQRLRRWLQRGEWPALAACAGQPDAAPAEAFAALRQVQLLCALRSGPFGADEVNRSLDARLREQHAGAQWYPGRPVLVRHNDYDRRLYNGDVGLALRADGRLMVCFESTDADGRTHHRLLLPNELPEQDLGYALTIHQSQGSEYEHVAVLLPPDGGNRVLSRQLLYTGVSRARRGLEIWASESSLAAALAQRAERNGGLRVRLQGA